MINNLVGGRPTPLKNDGVRQLGSFPINMESHKSHVPKSHVPNHQPDKDPAMSRCFSHLKLLKMMIDSGFSH